MTVLRFYALRGLITMAVSVTLSACAMTPPASVEPKKAPAADVSGNKLQLLHRQLQERDKLLEEREKTIEERDKRIEELEAQLDALRVIDQDRENQRKPVRPPTTLPPSR